MTSNELIVPFNIDDSLNLSVPAIYKGRDQEMLGNKYIQVTPVANQLNFRHL